MANDSDDDGPSNAPSPPPGDVVVPLYGDLDSVVTDYDRRLYARAGEIIDEVMAKRPAWVTDAQYETMRENLFIDLMLDPRGREMLESLVDGPVVEESEQVERGTGRAAKALGEREDQGEEGAG